MTVTRIAPALAYGLTGRVAPACAAAVREARIQWHYRRLQIALRAHARANAS